MVLLCLQSSYSVLGNTHTSTRNWCLCPGTHWFCENLAILLILKVPSKIVTDDILLFLLFFRDNMVYILCELPARQTIHMKCQTFLSPKNKKGKYFKMLPVAVVTGLTEFLLFVLRFYGPVNPMGSCWARSVYLTTRLLGSLRQLPFLNQRKGENDRRKYFMINLHERMLPTWAGVEPVTSWSPVGRRIQLSHRGRLKFLLSPST